MVLIQDYQFLTWKLVFEGVEGSDNHIDKHGRHENDVAPEGHVTRDPEESRIRSQLPLPIHFLEHVVHLGKEVRDF